MERPESSSVCRPESSSVCNDETLKPLQNLSNSKPNSNVEKVPPDGGWGWMIVIGGIIIVTLGTFPSFAFSYLFSPILKSQGVSSFIIAWIYNLRNLTGSICSLFIGPLCDEFGYRKTALLGGLTIFVSMILSAFATSPNLLFLSYALLEGIGSRILIIPTLIVSKYFQKRRGLATGLTSLLSSGHSIIAPLLPTFLLRYYDYKGSSLICAAIVLNQCVGAMLFQPVEWHMKLIKGEQLTEKILNEENKSEYRYSEDKIDLEAINIIPDENNFKMDNNSYCFNCCKIQSKSRKPISHIKLMADKINNKANHKNIKHTGTFIRVLKSTYENLKSLKNIRVQIIALAYCGFMLGYLNFEVWIPFIITDAGYSLESAAWCSSLTTIGNINGRLISSVLSDRKFFNVSYGYMFGLFLIGSSIIAFSMTKDITLYTIIICIRGFGIGLSTALFPLSTIDVMGVEMLPAMFGVSQLLQGFVEIMIGTLTGAVQDKSMDFTYTCWILGGCPLVGFCLWLLMPCAERFDRKLYQDQKVKNKCEQEAQNC